MCVAGARVRSCAAVRACAEKLLTSSGRVGSFSAQCQVDRSIVKDVNSMLGTENKFTRALWNNFAEIPADQSTECGVVYEVRLANRTRRERAPLTMWCEQNPVVVIMRYEAWNLYHQLGEWINAFTTLEVPTLSSGDSSTSFDGVGVCVCHVCRVWCACACAALCRWSTSWTRTRRCCSWTCMKRLSPSPTCSRSSPPTTRSCWERRYVHAPHSQRMHLFFHFLTHCPVSRPACRQRQGVLQRCDHAVGR